MLPFLTQLHFENTDITQKIIKGIDNLSRLREKDIESGVSPKEILYQEDKVILYRFKSQVENPHPVPLLMVYGLVNRPFIVDLQEGRSLVANLLKLGLDIYLIDWGYPTRADRWLTLDDYINGYLNNCVDFLCEQHKLNQINILGICQGGTFSSCYSSLYQEKIKNLITMVTPIDFDQKETLWIDVDLMVKALGNVPGDFLNLVFLMLKPFQLGYQKYLDFPDIMENKDNLTSFMRMEKWIFDSPDQAGETCRQFIKDFYQNNKLIKAEVMLGDKRVDLKNITMPVLNLYAEKDHLVPPISSLALEKYISSKDYTAQGFPVGHIGMYVSSKVQGDLPSIIVNWLQQRSG